MPLTRISFRRGKPAAYRRAIADSLYQAMRETFDVPENDFFVTISEHDADDFLYCPTYLDIPHSDDLVIVQLTVSNTRTLAQKRALFARCVERLRENPGVGPQDVFINLVEVLPENWSFGLGVAQYAKAQP